MAQVKNRPIPMRPWSPPVTMATKNDNRPLPMKPWTPDRLAVRTTTLAGTSRAVLAAGALSRRQGEQRYLPCPKFAELRYCYEASKDHELHEPTSPRQLVSTWVNPELPRLREYQGSRLEPRLGVGYHGNVDYRLTSLNHWGPWLCDLWRTEPKGKAKTWSSTRAAQTATWGQEGGKKKKKKKNKKTTFSDTVHTFSGEPKYQTSQGGVQKQSRGRTDQGSTPVNDTEVHSLIDVIQHGGTSGPKATYANHKAVTSLIDLDNDVSPPHPRTGRSLGNGAEVERKEVTSDPHSLASVSMETAQPQARRWYTRPKMDAYYFDTGLPPREEVGEEELSNFEGPPPEELGTGQVAKRSHDKVKKLPVTKVKAVTTLSRLPPEVQAAVSAYKAMHSRQ